MASASLTLSWSSAPPCPAPLLPFPGVSLINSWAQRPITLPGGPLVARRYSSAAVCFARRLRSSRPRRKAAFEAKDEEDDDGDDDLEALFQQLEEDLKNGRPSIGEDITDEDMAELEQELAAAFGDPDVGDEDDDGNEDSVTGHEEEEDDEDDDDNDTDEVVQPDLKVWQLRRLARALKSGKRRIKIKSFSAEIGLDRALVLDLLRNPPPKLIMMSACLPDEEEVPRTSGSKSAEAPPPRVDESPVVIETSTVENVDAVASKPKVNLPVHAMAADWYSQKRMKKVQVETLEKVYQRTKRPTNTMVDSIIHVTNLPRKRVVKWFEDRRLQDGVSERRGPYIKSASRSVRST